MENTFWQKQTIDKPLFKDLLWSRPENKKFAGKLLIIGGNLHGFAVPAQAYNDSLESGIGVVKVLLPDALRKSVGRVLEFGEYLPSTNSGSFSKLGLAELIEHTNWADGVLIAGELGRNSETSMLLENFVEKVSLPLTVTKDALDYFKSNPGLLLDRNDTMVVMSMAQLQKFATASKSTIAFKFSMNLNQLAEALHEFSKQHNAVIVVNHLNNIWVALGGKVSSTKLEEGLETWRVRTATKATVWWLQNPTKPFEAITTSLITK